MDYDDDDQSSATGSVPPPPPAETGGGGGGGVDNVAKQSNDADNDDENTQQQQQSSPSSSQKKILSLGGRSDKKCFALLDGIFEDPEHPETRTRVTIPITRLPAILGRTHDTDDPHFFGLGKKKALSRKQCLIEYRVTGKDGNKDGRVEWDDKKQKLVYKEKDGDSTKEKNKDKDKDKDDEISRDIDIDVENLPSNGYFAIGSMGKNRITVDQERIAHGKVALLKSGTPIRISSYCLYFLLPTDAPPLEHTIPSAPSSSQAAATTKKKKRKKGSSLQPDTAPSSDPAASQKKAKTTTTTNSSTTAGGSTTGNLQSEIDSMSVEELMDRMTEAIRNNEWDRKHQIMGTAISMHAVRAVAMDPSIQAMAMNDGVSRKAILDWIEKSDKYGDWVDLMLSKMELRSYQAAVTKSLIKSGYTKTGGFGRYVKWFLPKDIPIVVQKGGARSSVGRGSDEEPNDDDNDDGDQDEEDDDKEEDDEEEEEESEGDGNDEEQNEEEEEEEEAEQNGADEEEEHDGEGNAPEDDDDSSDSSDDEIPF